MKLLAEGEIDSFTIFNNIIVYQLMNDSSNIFIFKNGKSKIIMSDINLEFNITSEVLIDNKLPIYFTKTDNLIPEGLFLIDKDLTIKKTTLTNVYTTKTNQFYFNKSNKKVFSYNLDHQKKNEIDVSNCGNSIIEGTNYYNEIYGDLFWFNELLFVPLRKGQLLALNSIDGKKVWFWEHDRIGAYGQIGNKIYKQDGKEIFELSTDDGILIRSFKFSNETILDGFYASGPIWVYEDVIIVVDVLYGKICMIDRLEFKILDYFIIGKKISFDTNSIVWFKEKLYILDLENVLHIYE